MRHAIVTLALLALTLPPLSASAQSWGTGAGIPKMSELTPRMSSEESYTERYGFAVDLDGGGHIGIDFTISNLGFGDGHGAVNVRVYMPGEKRYEYNKKLSSSDWSADKSGFGLKFGNTTVSAKGNNGFVLKHNGSAKVDLTFENKIPMWKPGSGRIKVDGGYYDFNLIAPRADVSGRVNVNGTWVDVTGKRAGYADHVATNVAPFDFAKRFIRFRDYNEDVFVMWREIELADSHGGKSLTWIVIGYKDAIVFSDASATLKFGSVKKDAKTEYRVPRVVQVDGTRGNDSVRLQMHGRNMKRKDLLASYGAVAKLVASAVSKPYQFELKGKYTLQMTIGGVTANVEGRGHYTIDYLNL